MNIIQAATIAELDQYRDYSGEYDHFVNPAKLQIVALPRWTFLTFRAAGNTFSLLQKFGGVEMPWYEVGSHGKECSKPITRAECGELVKNMLVWLSKDTAEKEALEVGSDMLYAREMVDKVAACLAPDYDVCPGWTTVTFERFDDHDRELDEGCEAADKHSHEYWDVEFRILLEGQFVGRRHNEVQLS